MRVRMRSRSVEWWSVLAVLAVISVGCGSQSRAPAPPPEGKTPPTLAPPQTQGDAGVSLPDAGTSDAGLPDAGSEIVDAGTPPDAGPWPHEATLDYTQSFGLGTPQSVGLDEGLNLWLLDGNRIGVVRPGDTAPTWTSGVGQARQPFGWDSLAIGSTVICGGEAGRAYVGYRAPEVQRAEGISQRTYIPGPGEANYSPERYAEYQKGDLDAVRLQRDGAVTLEEHLWR